MIQVIKRQFDRVASHYNNNNDLQYETGLYLLQKLSLYQHDYPRIADLGCGTGSLTQRLLDYHPQIIVGIDLSIHSLVQAKQNCSSKIQWIHADFHRLPLKINQIDLVFANLSLHWGDLPEILTHIRERLTESGMIAFTLPLVGTFQELDNAFQKTDFSFYQHAFPSQKIIMKWLKIRKFDLLLTEIQTKSYHFLTVLDLIRSLKKTGTNVFTSKIPNALFGPSLLRQLDLTYPREKSRFPLTYQVGHFIARKGN